MPVQAPPISQVNPNVRLGQAASSQARLASTAASSSATSSAVPSATANRALASNTVTNDDILQQMIASNNLDRVAQAAPANRPVAAATPRLASASAAQAVARQADYNPTQSTVSARPATVASAMTRAAANQPVVHVVKAGETLYSLAKRYNTTVDGVKALNNIGTQAIKVGDRLRMPGSGAQS